MAAKRFDLEYSDLEVGHPAFGYASREDCRDEDEEDRRVAELMREKGYLNPRVADGAAWADLPLPVPR